MIKNKNVIIEQLVDYLLPELTPYETSIYLYLLRNSYFQNGKNSVRVGKRTIASGYGKGSRGKKTNYAHVSKILKSLEEKGCISINDINRDGTLYRIFLPSDIPTVAEKIKALSPVESDNDYFHDPEKRLEIFKRDKWICQYCGEKVTSKNATIDHFVPQFKGGKHIKENLRTCCLLCNGIKSGKTYEEAAPFLLKSIKERKVKSS